MATTTTPETRAQADGSVAVTPTVTPAVTPPSGASAIADPAPLGLAAFALTTALLSAFNAGKIPLASGGLVFVGMALAYGGLAQFAAGMWEFRKGNTFGATAFTSYASFWLGLGLLFVFDVVGRPVMPLFGGEGTIWFLFVWAVFTTYMWIASFRTNTALAVTFTLLTATFWALWLGALNSNAPGHNWTGLGGYLGLVTAAAAGYTSFAGVINSTFGKIVLPTFPLPSLPSASSPAAPAPH